MKFETEATISRSPDEIWAYAADILRHPEWMTVTDPRILAGSGTQVGGRGRERLIFGPFKWDVEFEVVEAEPARRIAWRSVGDRRLDLLVGLELEGLSRAATRANYRSAVRLRGPWRLLTPLLVMEGASGIRRELERLKANVERQPMAPAAQPTNESAP